LIPCFSWYFLQLLVPGLNSTTAALTGANQPVMAAGPRYVASGRTARKTPLSQFFCCCVYNCFCDHVAVTDRSLATAVSAGFTILALTKYTIVCTQYMTEVIQLTVGIYMKITITVLCQASFKLLTPLKFIYASLIILFLLTV
jgi:hypothetical protein